MTAIVRTDARTAARERFYRAAFEWFADQSCSNALVEAEDAYEALAAILRADLTKTLKRKRRTAA